MKGFYLKLMTLMGAVVCIGCLSTQKSIAQEPVYKVTEKAPCPVGGMSAFFEYTESHLQKTKEVVKKNVSGNVFVRFIIEKDGKISNVEIVKGLECDYDTAIVKLLENAPKWTPGTQQGKPVRVLKTISIPVR